MTVANIFSEKHPLARPRLERAFGECAFPIVIGFETYSCCNPTGETPKGEIETYCKKRRRVMYQQTTRVSRKVPDTRMKF